MLNFIPVPVGYDLKLPPGAQNEIQLDGDAGVNAVAPGMPVSPKHGQPSSALSASSISVGAMFMDETRYKIP